MCGACATVSRLMMQRNHGKWSIHSGASLVVLQAGPRRRADRIIAASEATNIVILWCSSIMTALCQLPLFPQKSYTPSRVPPHQPTNQDTNAANISLRTDKHGEELGFTARALQLMVNPDLREHRVYKVA